MLTYDVGYIQTNLSNPNGILIMEPTHFFCSVNTFRLVGWSTIKCRRIDARTISPTQSMLCPPNSHQTSMNKKPRPILGGPSRAQWEDVTGSTPLTFVNDCVSFTTTVSARFWLMDCRNIADATKMATDLYRYGNDASCPAAA